MQLLFFSQTSPLTSASSPFPTRRSSDLLRRLGARALYRLDAVLPDLGAERTASKDRKSTRLNSTHPSISYAVFCLKKKKKEPQRHSRHREGDDRRERRQHAAPRTPPPYG